MVYAPCRRLFNVGDHAQHVHCPIHTFLSLTKLGHFRCHHRTMPDPWHVNNSMGSRFSPFPCPQLRLCFYSCGISGRVAPSAQADHFGVGRSRAVRWYYPFSRPLRIISWPTGYVFVVGLFYSLVLTSSSGCLLAWSHRGLPCCSGSWNALPICNRNWAPESPRNSSVQKGPPTSVS